MALFLFILEIIGTVAFAVSGALLAVKKEMDVFGVCVMGVVTACGGGVLRDLMLGYLPPAMFREPVYALTAVGCSLLTMILFVVRRRFFSHDRVFDTLMLWSDALGLGVFTAAGVSAVFRAGFGDNFFFSVFLGTMTGVGGGVLRDVLARTPPYIFVRHIYACASILGAVVCTLLWRTAGATLAMLVCCGSVFALRILSAHYRWSLPKAKAGKHGHRQTKKTRATRHPKG
ncbi:MAG: trimeric intracellular cation channel family protein [Kiritimatiellae bacterium]|nr:trimeric intracellular cation channel family protein [Kiritimatiellia bacterium]